MNTPTTAGDPPSSPKNKQSQRQRAERVQRRREKAAGRRLSKRAEREADVQSPRLAWPIDEGAHRIGIGRTSVYKLAAEGKLRLIKVAGRTLIPDSEVLRIASEGA